MANLNLLVAAIAIVLMIAGVRSFEGETAHCKASRSSLTSEHDRLRSKIAALDSIIEDRNREIRSKENSIARLDNIIREKLSFLKKNLLDANILSQKVDAWVDQLEEQIVKLIIEIEALDIQASEAEKKVQELNQNLKSVHEAWLPPWIGAHISHIQDVAKIHWKEHGKPAIVFIMRKVSEKFENVQKWSEYLFLSATNIWIPAAKEQLLIFKSDAGPYLQKMSSKTFEVYEASKNVIAPCIFKLQEAAYPCFQEAREFSKPYIDQAITVIGSYVEKLLVLMPYREHVVHVFHKFLTTSKTYHSQVQHDIYEKLQRHELTKPHATEELTWVLASALLALPVFFLYRVLALVLSEEAEKEKPKWTAHSSQGHWRQVTRPKRRHTGK